MHAAPRASIARTYGVGASCALLALLCCKTEPVGPAAPPAPTGAAEARVDAAPIQVAAASDLARALPEVGTAFELETGHEVVFTFGASGMLAKQIREGAPYDMFAAANAEYADEAVEAGACDASTRAPYARGHLVLWTPAGVAKAASLADLTDPRFRRIAIANPEHAPYGKAAKQALGASGLWQTLKPRIVYGENIRQTLQYAQSGNAEAALVALSLVFGARDGSYVAIDQALHAPIDQTLVVCMRGKNAAGGRAFAGFVHGSAGRALLRRHGFLLPGESPPLLDR